MSFLISGVFKPPPCFSALTLLVNIRSSDSCYFLIFRVSEIGSVKNAIYSTDPCPSPVWLYDLHSAHKPRWINLKLKSIWFLFFTKLIKNLLSSPWHLVTEMIVFTWLLSSSIVIFHITELISYPSFLCQMEASRRQVKNVDFSLCVQYTWDITPEEVHGAKCGLHNTLSCIAWYFLEELFSSLHFTFSWQVPALSLWHEGQRGFTIRSLVIFYRACHYLKWSSAKPNSLKSQNKQVIVCLPSLNERDFLCIAEHQPVHLLPNLTYWSKGIYLAR